MSADFPSRRAWLSDPFPAPQDRGDLEDWFAWALASRGVRAPFVQCPRPVEKADAVAAYGRARKTLAGLGFRVVRVHPGEESRS